MTDRNSAIRLKEHHNSMVPILYSFRVFWCSGAKLP